MLSTLPILSTLSIPSTQSTASTSSGQPSVSAAAPAGRAGDPVQPSARLNHPPRRRGEGDLGGDKAAGDLARYTYTPDGRVQTITCANGVVTTHAYYANGWLRSVESLAAAGELVSRYEYDYDADGQRTAQREWNATPARRAAEPLWATAPAVTTYAYDDFGRLSGVGYPDGRTMVYTYDAVGNRLSEVETDGAGAPVRDRSFHYNARHQVEYIRDRLTPARSVRYAYNAAGDTVAKITGELDGDGQVVQEDFRLAFTWDAWGRLRRVTRLDAPVDKSYIASLPTPLALAADTSSTPTTRAETHPPPPGNVRGRTATPTDRSGKSGSGAAGYSTAGRPSAAGEGQVMAEFCYDHAGRRIRQDSQFVMLGEDLFPTDTRLTVYDQQSCLAEYAPSAELPGALIRARQYLYGTDLLAVECGGELENGRKGETASSRNRRLPDGELWTSHVLSIKKTDGRTV